jgi:CTP synthase
MADEVKTKPTQHSVKELTSLGIQPNIIILRSERVVEKNEKAKIALFCNVDEDRVITAPDVDNIYNLPLVLHEEGLDSRVCEKLNIWTGSPHLEAWKNVVKVLRNPQNGDVRISIVGKYVDLKESYKSLSEALTHGAIANKCNVKLTYIDSEDIEKKGLCDDLMAADGILIPGGFGKRGGEGKIKAVQYARENNIPFLGICLGLQMAVVEYARHVAGLENAQSTEFEPDTSCPVIDIMENQKELLTKGANMRLGAYNCTIKEGTLAARVYRRLNISERHRHRYEVNNAYRKQLEDASLILSGLSPDNNLVEMIEIKEHPWFIAVQFHPEFLSKPLNPHPLFSGFIEAALELKKKHKKNTAIVSAPMSDSEKNADSLNV